MKMQKLKQSVSIIEASSRYPVIYKNNHRSTSSLKSVYKGDHFHLKSNLIAAAIGQV